MPAPADHEEAEPDATAYPSSSSDCTYVAPLWAGSKNTPGISTQIAFH